MGPDYSLGTVGKCLWPTMSESLQKMFAKYFEPALQVSTGDKIFTVCLQCFDAVGWSSGRASGL